MASNDTPTGTPISRRRLLQGGALLGVAAFLAACGTKGTVATGTPAPTSAATPSTAPSTAASAGASASASAAASASTGPTPTPSVASIPTGTPANVNWANWTLYIDVDKNGNHPTIQAFQKKYNVKVTYKEAINDNEQFFGKIKPNLEAGQAAGPGQTVVTGCRGPRLPPPGEVGQAGLGRRPRRHRLDHEPQGAVHPGSALDRQGGCPDRDARHHRPHDAVPRPGPRPPHARRLRPVDHGPPGRPRRGHHPRVQGQRLRAGPDRRRRCPRHGLVGRHGPGAVQQARHQVRRA